MANLLTHRPTMSAGATRLAAVSFAKDLDADALLTGTPTVTEVGKVTFDADGKMVLDDDGLPTYIASTDLTLSNKAVNTAQLTILGDAVAIGKAVQFLVTGTAATIKGNTYIISISCATTSSPAETLVWWALLRVT